jgi:chaperonin GroES
MTVDVGDVVIFTQWAGSEIKDMGDGMLVMRESDIIGIVEKSTIDQR